MSCRLTTQINAAGYQEVCLANDLIAVSVLPERGAEIASLVHKASGVDVLWKAPWGMHRQKGGDTETLWMDGYAGGWQEILPNGGDPCEYKGAHLGFHGEASVSQWECEPEQTAGAVVSALFSVRLARSPLVLQRRMIVEAGNAVVRVEEELTNAGEEELQFMWGHHPAYGEPFLIGDCRLIAPAGRYLTHGEKEPKPWTGSLVIDGPEARNVAMGYLVELSAGWYELRNQRLGFGVRWDWDAGLFPYVWLWRELRGSFGYPWYGRCYVMGVEPFTSIPGSGLLNAIEHGSACSLAGGESIKTELKVSFIDGAN